MYVIYKNMAQSVWGLELIKSLFCQLVSAMSVFSGIYSHLKNESGYRRF